MLNYVRQFIKIRVVFHTLYIWNEDGGPQFFGISGKSGKFSREHLKIGLIEDQ